MKNYFLLDKPLLGCFRRVFCKIKQILSKVKLWRYTTNMKLCFNVTDLAAFALLRIKALWRGDLTSELMKFLCEGYLWLHHHFSRITDKSTWDDDWPIARNLENSAVLIIDRPSICWNLNLSTQNNAFTSRLGDDSRRNP